MRKVDGLKIIMDRLQEQTEKLEGGGDQEDRGEITSNLTILVSPSMAVAPQTSSVVPPEVPMEQHADIGDDFHAAPNIEHINVFVQQKLMTYSQEVAKVNIDDTFPGLVVADLWKVKGLQQSLMAGAGGVVLPRLKVANIRLEEEGGEENRVDVEQELGVNQFLPYGEHTHDIADAPIQSPHHVVPYHPQRKVLPFTLRHSPAPAPPLPWQQSSLRPALGPPLKTKPQPSARARAGRSGPRRPPAPRRATRPRRAAWPRRAAYPRRAARPRHVARSAARPRRTARSRRAARLPPHGSHLHLQPHGSRRLTSASRPQHAGLRAPSSVRRPPRAGLHEPLASACCWPPRDAGLRPPASDVHEIITNDAKKGQMPSQIGLVFHDPEIPEDLYFIIKRAVVIRKHLEENRRSQLLFYSSEESGQITRNKQLLQEIDGHHAHWVHSYHALPLDANKEWSSIYSYGKSFTSSFDRQAGRLEIVVLPTQMYHSLLSYECWLSSIDVPTQMFNQQSTELFWAVVIDPTRIVASGNVDIEVFRAYLKDYKSPDFGVHSIEDSDEVMEGIMRERPYKLSELDYLYLLEFTANNYGIFEVEGRQQIICMILAHMKADRMKPHTSTYNILLKIRASEHNLKESARDFENMNREKVEPNETTYCILAIAHAVARVCTKSQINEEAIENSMTETNWSTLKILIILHGYLGMEGKQKMTWNLKRGSFSETLVLVQWMIGDAEDVTRAVMEEMQDYDPLALAWGQASFQGVEIVKDAV